MSRNLAIVPAHNEAEAIGATIAAIRRCAPDFDVLVVDDGSTDATAERARRRGRHGAAPAVQPRHRRRDAERLPLRAWSTATRWPCRSTATASTIRATSTTCSRACAASPDLNMVTGSRFLDPDGEGYRSSAARRVGIRVFSRVVSLITGRRVTDPTSGFRMTDRRGIELFARDYPHDYPEVEAILLDARPPPEQLRDPGGDAPAPDRHLGDLLDPVGLLHGQGAAGGVRGAVPRRGPAPSSSRRRPRSRRRRAAEARRRWSRSGRHDDARVATHRASRLLQPAHRGDRPGRGRSAC